MQEKYVSVRCFYDRTHQINVPREVFDSDEKGRQGFIKEEYKGKVLPNGVFVGAVGIYCNERCRDDFCGPRPKHDEESEARELEEKCKKLEEWERELKKD